MIISIQDKLKEKNMTRYELANRIGVTYPTIDNIYKSRTNSIKFDILSSICNELDCTPSEILIETDEENNQKAIQRLLKYADSIKKATHN